MQNQTETTNTAQPIQGAVLTYTLPTACAMSGLSHSTLRRHAARGALRLVRVGRRTLVDAASLRALLGVSVAA